MSFLEFKTIRFDKQFGIKDGKVFTDNENGNNAFVVVAKESEAEFTCAYNFLIENDPDLADIFKGTREMTLIDFEVSFKGKDENGDYMKPTENTVYEASVREDGCLEFTMNGRKTYFNTNGIPFENYILGHWDATQEFKYYINKKLSETLTIEPGQTYFPIEDCLITGEIFGFVRKDGKNNLIYESSQVKEWKNVSMAEVGIKRFYDIIEEDIVRTGVYADDNMFPFWKLWYFMKETQGVRFIENEDFDDAKNVKINKLYDKLYRKGKTTLVPGEDSNLMGYYITHGANVHFGCCACGGSSRMKVNTFLSKLDQAYLENYGVDITPIRKRNLESETFVLKFNNDLKNPRIFYEGEKGETIELIQKKDMNYIKKEYRAYLDY